MFSGGKQRFLSGDPQNGGFPLGFPLKPETRGALKKLTHTHTHTCTKAALSPKWEMEPSEWGCLLVCLLKTTDEAKNILITHKSEAIFFSYWVYEPTLTAQTCFRACSDADSQVKNWATYVLMMSVAIAQASGCLCFPRFLASIGIGRSVSVDEILEVS